MQPVMPHDIIDQSDNDQYLRNFIDTAGTIEDVTKNATRVASEIHLAKTIKHSGDEFQKAMLSMTESLSKALAEHAEALIRSAQASEKYSKNLNHATWALVAVTFILALITAIPLIAGQIK